MTVTIDTTRCIGCGMCAYVAPEVFCIQGKFSTVLTQPEQAQAVRVSTAANGCPVNAISVKR
ncbi:MAG: ferredoxin [Ruminococcaceae bacterium]|nr:ferredoxin [Oscillospiraceae bacterium]